MNPNQLAIPRARRSDPSTSHEAAASVRDISTSQRWILSLYHIYGPMPDHLLCFRYRKDRQPVAAESGIRTRRKELVRRGLVIDTGETVRLPSGRQAILWGLA